MLTADNPAIIWPPVHSGNIRGKLAVYLSADATGQVREVWPLNSDNAGLEDPTRDQIRHWHLKPVRDKEGNPVQVDGALGFAFETVVGDPLPQLSDGEVRSLASHIVEPQFTPGSLPSGTNIDVQVSINEQGKLTGTGWNGVPNAAFGPVSIAIDQWTFRPYLRDGKPQYIHGTLRFVVP